MVLKDSDTVARRLSRTWILFGTLAIFGTVACVPNNVEDRSNSAEMTSYACALVSQIRHASPSEWANSSHGINEAVITTSVVALLGGASGYPLDEQDELFKAARETFTGLADLEDGRIETGIEGIQEACSERFGSSNVPSVEENVSYACDLADEFNRSSLKFQELFLNDVELLGSDEAVLFNKAFGASALLGGIAGSVLPNYPDLSAAANGLYAGLNRLDPQMAADNLSLIVDLCPIE